MPAQPNILVIDDDDKVLELLQDALSDDYRVQVAKGALQGVERMIGQRFDLLIVDLGMPGIGGDELIRKIRANSTFDRIPILIVSAYPERYVRLRATDAQGVLAKPFSIDQLCNTVTSLLGAARKSPSSA